MKRREFIKASVLGLAASTGAAAAGSSVLLVDTNNKDSKPGKPGQSGGDSSQILTGYFPMVFQPNNGCDLKRKGYLSRPVESCTTATMSYPTGCRWAALPPASWTSIRTAPRLFRFIQLGRTNPRPIGTWFSGIGEWGSLLGPDHQGHDRDGKRQTNSLLGALSFATSNTS